MFYLTLVRLNKHLALKQLEREAKDEKRYKGNCVYTKAGALFIDIYPSKQRRAFVLDKIYFNVLLNSKNIY